MWQNMCASTYTLNFNSLLNIINATQLPDQLSLGIHRHWRGRADSMRCSTAISEFGFFLFVCFFKHIIWKQAPLWLLFFMIGCDKSDGTHTKEHSGRLNKNLNMHYVWVCYTLFSPNSLFCYVPCTSVTILNQGLQLSPQCRWIY